MAKLTKEYTKQQCESCNQLKPCHMYILQNGNTAWVCDSCRVGNLPQVSNASHHSGS